MRHYEESIVVNARPPEVFAFSDDFHNFSSHMNQSSAMMAGGKFKTVIDEGNFQRVGSHIKMSGKILGLSLYLNEMVSERIVPRTKRWETVGIPKLIVIGSYIMSFEIKPVPMGSNLTVTIDYGMPRGIFPAIVSTLFGTMYAKWCVRQMTLGVQNHFNNYGNYKY